jgi:hypothetical protein
MTVTARVVTGSGFAYLCGMDEGNCMLSPG